ncbi:MAG: GNAT family N-acetyltransferase [Bryobacteraceae bacterium]
MLLIRRGEPRDLAAVAAIQAESPEASEWEVGGYPQLDFWVAAEGGGALGDSGRIAGFLVARTLAPGERELLNMAVAARLRRRGIARELVTAFLKGSPGAVFLEVRESNQGARDLYKSMGFHEVGLRRNYYQYPPEAAIVMKFHSC